MIDERIKTKERGEQALELATKEIRRINEQLESSDETAQLAIAIYQRSLNEDFIQNRSFSEVAAASFYAACRKEKLGCHLSEVSRISSSSRRIISHTYTELINQLELEVGPVDPTQYVPRYCEELGLSEAVEEKAKEIIETCAEDGLVSGRSPSKFAASSVYLSSILKNEKVTQREIADMADASVSTIRYQYHEQVEHVGIFE